MPSPRVVGRSSQQDVVRKASLTRWSKFDARGSSSGNDSNNSNQGNNSGGGGGGNNSKQNGGGGQNGGNSGHGSSCIQSGGFNGNYFHLLDDNDPSIVYLGNWSIITGNAQAGDATQHTTTDLTASLHAPFTGTQITVIGTVPNGTEPIIVNYSIDGGPPQTRSVPTSSQCVIDQDPFFSMTGLKNESHYINITVANVTTRPYFFNYLALDLKASAPHVKKSNAGKIAGGVIGGLIFLALICGVFFFFWRRSRSSNIYAQNRAIDARLQQWIVPQDAINGDMQKQFSVFGSSEGSIRDSVPTIPADLGQRRPRGGLTRIFGSSRGSTPSWITSTRDTVSSHMRFSENPALPRSNIPPVSVFATANANGLASHFSPNTSIAFSPPAGKWDEIPVNDARTREMSQITEGQVTTVTTPKSLNALASQFSPNTSVALSTQAPAYKWEDVLASVKEAAAGNGVSDDQVSRGLARGRIPSIIIEDQPNRQSSGQTIHSAISGSEDGQGRAV